MVKRFGALAPAIAAGALVLGACGGDDGGSDGSASDDDATSGDVSAEAAGFCDDMAAFQEQANNPPAGPSGMQDYFSGSVDLADSVDPPEELADDWATVKEGFSAAEEAAGEVDWDALQSEVEAAGEDMAAVEQAMADAMEPMSVLEDERFVEAGERIDSYMDENCGTGSGGASDSGSESGSGSDGESE